MDGRNQRRLGNRRRRARPVVHVRRPQRRLLRTTVGSDLRVSTTRGHAYSHAVRCWYDGGVRVTGGLEQTSHPWSRIAQDWERYFTVPSRPSAEEVAQYRRWVGRSDIPRRALVLGATPELRDVLFECGLEVHVIDMSLEMVLAMTELLATTTRTRRS